MDFRSQHVVLSLVVCVLAITAGCSALQTSPESTTNLLIANQDNSGHAVVVEIMDGERKVYSDGQTIEAESDAGLTSFNQSGEYEVKVTVDGNSTVLTHDFRESQSITTIGIDNDANVTIGT